MFRCVKHYHQRLCSSSHLKTKFSQSSPDSIRLQGPPKRPSSGLLYPVSSVKERNRKGGKCKISWVLQSPVSSPQASPKVEASNRPEQAQHLLTCRKVQNGNTRVLQVFSDSRGIGIVNRLIRRLPSHPHPPKLKEVPKVLPQFTGVPVHLPSLRASHGPTGLYSDCKRNEADGPDKGNQTSPIPGRLAYQGSVSGRSTMNTQTVVDLTQSLGWIINQEKSELKPTQVFLFLGYEYHLDSALVKPTQERWLKLQDLILRLKSKCVLTAKCVMSLIGLLASMEKMVPEGRLHMRPFQFHLKEHWRYPQLLDILLPWSETISDLHPKDHSIQLCTDASNEGWGTYLEQASTKGLWSDREKRLHINVLELKAVSLALQRFKDQCQNQTVLVAMDNSTVGAYIQTRRNPLGGDVCSPVQDHDLVPSLPDNLKSQTHSRVSECDGRPSVQVESSPVHRMVLKQICPKWFTPHVDLFATSLNHKVPLYVSPVPDQNAWDIDALNINWSGLTAYVYHPTSLLYRVIQKVRQSSCLIIVIAPDWPGMPWFWDLVQLSTEIPLHLPVSRTLLKQSHNYVFHSHPQHLNLHAWCLGVDSSKDKASLWRWQRELLPLRGH